MNIKELKEQFLSQYIMSSECTKNRYDKELTQFFNICKINTTEDLENGKIDKIKLFYEYSKTNNWKPSTLNLRLQTAKLFTKWARKKNYTQNDCLEDVKRVRTVNEVHYIPPTEDCEKFTQYIDKHTKKKRLSLMIKLIIHCGFRRNEICELKIEDIDKRNFEIKVFGKGKKIISQPVPHDLMLDIVDYINTERAEIMQKYKNLGGKDKGYLFLSGIGDECNILKKNLTNGNKVDPKVLYQQIKRYAKASGIANPEGISPHALRRYGGTEVYKITGDIKMAKEFLRHSNIATTEKHYIGFDKSELVNTINDLYKKDPQPKNVEFTQDDEYQLFLLLKKKYG